MSDTITQHIEERDALVERLFEATIGALELYSLHLGWRLGLYTTLVTNGPLTAGELAEHAAIDSRYAREWLEQQAVAGFLTVDTIIADAEARRYGLPPGHAEVLCDPESTAHVAPFAPMLVGIAAALPDVVDAYRSGAGVPYTTYGPDFRDGQGAINRPAFTHDLPGWLESIPIVRERLNDTKNPGRVADVGCGQGWAAIGIARAFPHVQVDGIDSDEASILDAKQHATDAGVDDRARFTNSDAAGLSASGPYDLICILEALHDMSRPVEVLSACRNALAPDGSIVVADERVCDEYTAPGDEVERMMFGWSVTHCLPASRSDDPSAALGTALREATVRRLADEAGMPSTEVLPIENDFFRFYRLQAPTTENP